MSQEINFPGYKVPVDDEDYKYIKSFGLADPQGILEFWDKYGFVVIRDILTPEECQATVDEIYSLCEDGNEKFDRNNPTTWDNWPKDGMSKFGMPTRDPVFATQHLRNRQNPNLHRAFATLFGSDDLIVSHDRCCLLRPTNKVPFPDGTLRDCPQWKSPSGIHLDMNVWDYSSDNPNRILKQLERLTYYDNRLNNFIQENNWVHKSFAKDGRSVQGVLNLIDNYAEDGGFQCVPGFKNHFDDFVKNTKIAYEEAPSLKFGSDHWLVKHSIRISLRAGSIVIWDQRTPHGGGTNNSSRPRSCLFVKMYPRTTLLLDPDRYDRRKNSMKKRLREANFTEEITDLGRQVFGLEELDPDFVPPQATVENGNNNQGGRGGNNNQGGRGGNNNQGGRGNNSGGRGRNNSGRGGRGGRVQGRW